MKRNMKKLLGMLMLVVCMFALTACGTQETLPNEEEYRARSDQYVTMLVGMSEDALESSVTELEENFDDFEQEVALFPYIGGTGSKFDFTAEAYLSLFKTYYANLDEFGAYVGVKEYEGGSTNADNETTYNTVYEFTEHDMRMSLVFDKDNVVINVTADPIYDTGEILVKAGLNTLLGMGVVFAVLILLSLIISCFGIIPKIEAKLQGKKEAPKAEVKKAAPAPAPKAAPAPAAATDDLALVAVITAAVAAAMGTSTDGFVVRSIKRKSNNKWKKA